MYKKAFSEYLYATNVAGSKKAASYIRALDLLEEMLQTTAMGFEDCQDIWTMGSVERLSELYDLANTEKSKGEGSVWNQEQFPKSYLQNGYCTAALHSYQEFLIEYTYEQDGLNIFNDQSDQTSDIAKKLERVLHYPQRLIEGLSSQEGKEVVRIVKARANQNVFRKMIMQIYQGHCCVTGLNIPAVNRASHIIPWSENESTRLDPQNGLYLSATYDAAFDRNLMSLDEDYRIIISKEIKDHYANDNVRTHFLSKEGERITMPNAYSPKQEYLEEHRKKGAF